MQCFTEGRGGVGSSPEVGGGRTTRLINVGILHRWVEARLILLEENLCLCCIGGQGWIFFFSKQSR